LSDGGILLACVSVGVGIGPLEDPPVLKPWYAEWFAAPLPYGDASADNPVEAVVAALEAAL
jgi:hypothetical protein